MNVLTLKSTILLVACFAWATTVQATLLHWAAREGQLTNVRSLLDKGYDVDARDSKGKSPLHEAVSNGHLDITKLLLERGANVDARESGGGSPLHAAVSNGHLDITKLLLERGANVAARESGGESPLHAAVSNGHLDITKLLLERDAYLEAPGKYGVTPLGYAAKHGEFQSAQLLIRAGANINARSNGGITIMHLAARGGDVQVVGLLLEMGADINAVANDGRTPLDFALEPGPHNENTATVIREMFHFLREHQAKRSPSCVTSADVEKMNRGNISRLFRLQGIDARIFLALDPSLLTPDTFELLMEQDIDEIVAWDVSHAMGGGGLAAAIPFSGGCRVSGYGGPDHLEKIEFMRDIVRLIKRRGVDDERVKSRMVDDLKYAWGATQEEWETKIDAMLARVRSLLESASEIAPKERPQQPQTKHTPKHLQ